MIGPLAAMTVRQLLGKRRLLVLAAFGVLPLVVAIIFRAFGDGEDAARWLAGPLFGGMILTILLPLAALIFGTGVLGTEIEDGTAVYILATPRERWRILVTKLAVAWVVTAAFVLVAALPAAFIAGDGSRNSMAVITGFAVAIPAGSLVYAAVFVFLSVLTSRAFVAGLIYVLIWEGLVTRLFKGVRIFSVRQYTLGVADGVAGVSDRILDAALSPGAAVALMVVATALTTWLAVRRLERFELGETT